MSRLVLVLLVIAPLLAVAQEAPKSVRNTMKDYESSLAHLARTRDSDINTAWKSADDKLDEVLKDVMKRGDLEEANRINALRADLRSRYQKRAATMPATVDQPKSIAAHNAKSELAAAAQKTESEYAAHVDKTAKFALDALDARVKGALQSGNLAEANEVNAFKKRFETQIRLAGKFPPGTVAVYTFDRDTFFKKDNKEYIRDLSGNENHLLAEDVKPAPDRVAGAITISGKGSKLTSARPLGITGESPRSISVWTYFESAPTGRFQHILGWGEPENRKGFFISSFEGAHMVWAHGSGNDWGTGHKIASKTWQHHVITYDGKTVTWYIDATPLPKTFDIKYDTADTPLRTGATPVALDELCIYNRALSPDEIRQLFARESK